MIDPFYGDLIIRKEEKEKYFVRMCPKRRKRRFSGLRKEKIPVRIKKSW
jgi:hypothetical protein